MKDRYRRFVDNFFGKAQGNATQAAILSGVPVRGAHVQASRMLRDVKVQALMKQRIAKRTETAIADADERDTVLSTILRTGDKNTDRIAAAKELNKCTGRHSITHILKGKLTLEEAVTTARVALPAATEK